MSKLTALLLSCLLPIQAMAASSLTFSNGSTNRVSYGNASSLNTLPACTHIFWFKPGTLSNFNNVIFKGNKIVYINSTDELDVFVQRTSAADVFTNNTNLTSVWTYVAVTFDINGGAGQVIRIYTGSLTALATERTYDAGSTDGSGTQTSDAANTQNIGSDGGGNLSTGFDMAFFGIWNRVFTLAEIQDQQFIPHITSGNVLFSYPGFNGTGTQYDLSGTGNNGTVTGAVVSSNGPPISIPGGPL